VKLVDGTTVSMPDTAENQARFPQHGQQEPGVGFPLARLVRVIALSTGAVLDAAIGPYQGKGTGEHGLFRGLKECFVEGDVIARNSKHGWKLKNMGMRRSYGLNLVPFNSHTILLTRYARR